MHVICLRCVESLNAFYWQGLEPLHILSRQDITRGESIESPRTDGGSWEMGRIPASIPCCHVRARGALQLRRSGAEARRGSSGHCILANAAVKLSAARLGETFTCFRLDQPGSRICINTLVAASTAQGSQTESPTECVQVHASGRGAECLRSCSCSCSTVVQI